MLRIAMLSKWHVHAANYAQFIQDQPDAQIACVWDEDPVRGQRWGEEMNVPFLQDLDTLLSRPDVDAVIIDAPTSMHKDLMVRAAKAGKHIFTEKCMCLTTADCDEVIKAVEDAGVIFTISFPQRVRGRSLLVKKYVEEGVLGDVTLLRKPLRPAAGARHAHPEPRRRPMEGRRCAFQRLRHGHLQALRHERSDAPLLLLERKQGGA